MSAMIDLALGVGGARERCLEPRSSRRAPPGLDELASTGYSNVAYLDVEQRRLRAAEQVLEESLPFTVERDIPICHHWQTGVRSRLRFLEGRWSAALEDAGDVLAHDPACRWRMLWPLIGQRPGASAARRIGRGPARGCLGAGRAARRAAPSDARAVGLGRADVADRHARRSGDAPRRTDPAVDATVRRGVGRLGDLAVWLRRLGSRRRRPRRRRRAVPARPVRVEHEEAAAWWHRRAPSSRRRWRSRRSDLGAAVRGSERLDLLGATATADRLRRRLRQDGVDARAAATSGQHPGESGRADQPAARRGQARGPRVHQRRDRRPALHLAARPPTTTCRRC